MPKSIKSDPTKDLTPHTVRGYTEVQILSELREVHNLKRHLIGALRANQNNIDRLERLKTQFKN